MAATRVPALDYTTRDFEAIRDDMIRGIPFYTPEWTDHNASDFGIVLLSLLAGQLDVLHFYIDRMAAESFITTAVKRESVIKLLRLIGFELRSIVPASVDVVFTLEGPLNDAVLIPEGTIVQTVASENQSPVSFETVADLTIPALSLTGTVGAVEGQSDDEDLGTSTGQAFQSFPISASVIVEGSLELFVDEGSGEVLWNPVTSFVSSLATDEDYRFERDGDDLITTFTGDNLQGKIPAASATLRAAFRVITGDRGGPGVYGNVGANTITILSSTIFVGGRSVTLSVNNPAQASGGEDRQSIEEAKRLGPASLKALGRAVTATDYKTLVEQLGGIAKVRVIQGLGTDPCCACNLDLYVAPAGGGNASSALKQTILDYLDTVKMVGTCVVIKDPTYVGIDIAGTTFVVANVNQESVESDVNQAVIDFFDLENPQTDFGRDLFLGNLFAAIENVDGVDHVDLDQVSRVPDPVLEVWSGDGVFGVVTVGQAATDETWTVTFLSPTTFSVVGDVSGIQTDGVVDVTYTSDISEISFLLSTGVTPNVIGDRATFVTSKLLGNVPIEDNEIITQGTINLTFAVVPTTTTGTICA
jgi:uncharacterized phage protein gp47/JayE